MPRLMSRGKLVSVVQAATQIFIARGYKQTQMADIATSLGVAKGTVYCYVESKEALFDAAIRFADREVPAALVDALPLRTPKESETLRYVEKRLQEETQDMLLPQLLSGERRISVPLVEIEGLISDLLSRLDRNRFAIELIDQCSADFPELAKLWFGQGPWEHHRLLAQLIRTRGNEGTYRLIESPDVLARTLIESIAIWGRHRRFDPSPQSVDGEQVRRTLVDLFAHALLKEGAA